MGELTRETWVAALRSGKYEQGKGFLRKDDKFCCLGVACDVDNPEGWDVNDVGIGYYLGRHLYLPTALCETLNLRPDDVNDLSRWNDSGETFEEIADRIEAMPR